MKHIYIPILVLVFYIFFSVDAARAADYYWVNGEGYWYDYQNHWATTTGGTVMHTAVPGSDDNVFFDVNSFTAPVLNQRVMMEGSPAVCNNMDWSGALYWPKIVGSQPLYIHGYLKFIPNMIVDYNAPTYFKAANKTVSITTAGNSLPVAVFFDGQEGHWELQDMLDVSGNIIINLGHLITNSYAVNCFRFNSNPLNQSNVRAFDMGSSIITIELADDNANSIFSCNINNDLGTLIITSSGMSKIIFLGSLGSLSTMYSAKNLTYDDVDFYGDGHLLSEAVTFQDVLFRSNGTLHVTTSVFDTVEIYKKGLAYSNSSIYNCFLFSTHPGYCGCGDCRNYDFGLLQGDNNQVTKMTDFHRNGTIKGNNNFSDTCKFEANGNILTGANTFNKLMMRRIWTYGCSCPSYSKDTLTLEKNKIQTVHDTIILYGDYFCEHPRITSSDTLIQATLGTDHAQFFDYIELKGINGTILLPSLSQDTAKRSIDLGNNSNWYFKNNYIPLEDSAVLVTNVSPCSNDKNGTVTLWGKGGEKPYTYWRKIGTGGCYGGFVANSPPTKNIFTGLSKGTYHFMIMDSYGCESVSIDTIVGGPDPVIIDSAKILAIPCYNVPPNTNGQVVIYAKGGTGAYQFYLDEKGWQTGSTFTNVSIGKHQIQVMDAVGCVSVFDTITMTQRPEMFMIIQTPQTVTCWGDSSGIIRIQVWGGTFPDSVIIEPIAPWHPQQIIRDIITASNLGNPKTYLVYAGSYHIIIKDTNGCILEDYRQVFENPRMDYTYVKTTVTVGNSTTYCLDVTPSGGVPPYTHLWNNGTTVKKACGLIPGLWCDTITDSKGCRDTACILIEPLALLPIVPDTVCYGICNGFVCASPSGGSTPYAYTWSNGATQACINGACPGNYTVTVTDASGGIVMGNVMIYENPLITAAFVVDTVSCGGGSDGSITITASGGTPLADPPGYTFLWSNGSVTNVASGLSAGTYTVTVTDSIGCSRAFSVAMPQPPPINIAFKTSSNCITYSAEAIVTGGNPPYTYLWAPGFQTSNPATGLIPGVYSVTVTDSKNCSKTASVTISALAVATATQNIKCYGICSGTASATVSGGNTPYAITWRDHLNVVVPGNPISNLCPGDYTVTVLDSNNCSVSKTITISQPANPLEIVTLNYTQMLDCYGDCDGIATVFAGGGTSPYGYQWENSATPGIIIGTTQSLTGLCTGTYCVTVTDFNSCPVTSCFTVSQPQQILFTHVQTDINCYADGDIGQITIGNVTGGTPPYVYTIHCPEGPFVSSTVFTGLPPGTYSLGVMDSKGCKSSCTSVTILRPPDISINFNPVQNPTGNGLNNGSITSNASGGVPPYTHYWFNSSGALIMQETTTPPATSTLPDLFAGTYCDSVVDANNCFKKQCATLIAPSALVIRVDSSNISCFGQQDGWINLTISGGVPPYSVLYNGVSTIINSLPYEFRVQNLSASTYTFVVTDANMNTAVRSVTIIEPLPVVMNFLAPVVCFGNTNGTITATPSQGTAPYTYLWSTGATTNQVSGLAPDQYYYLTIHDSRNCMAYDSVFLPVNPQVIVHVNNTDSSVCKGSNLQMDVNAYGGTFPYYYSWLPVAGVSNPSILEPTIAPVFSETYVITMVDANLCTAKDSITIYIDSIPAAGFSFSNICQSRTVVFTNMSTGYPTSGLDYLWDFGDGNLSVLKDPVHTYTGGLGTYNVSLTVTNGQGCTDYKMDTITINPVIQVEFSADTACLGTATQLWAQSLNPNTVVSEMKWYFDADAPVVLLPPQFSLTHLFTYAGFHSVKLVMSDMSGCSDSIVKQVLVRAAPAADFTYTWHCTNDTVWFTDLTPGSGSGTTQYLWEFGDPGSGAANFSNSQNPFHIYHVTGLYNVKLTVTFITNGQACSNTKIHQLYYDQSPNAAFVYENPCFGQSTLFTDQSYASTGSIIMWKWDFDDFVSGFQNTSNFQNPLHTFTAPGTYHVKLKVYDNTMCFDSIILPVVIYPTPAANFRVSEKCVGEVTMFHDMSVPSGAPINQWHWDFGDTQTLTYATFQASVPHIYTLSGTYTVTLTVHDQNGCSQSLSKIVNVHPLPAAMFQFSPACSNQTTYFTDYSNGSGSNIIGWNWNFGDPGSQNNTSALQNPSHTYTSTGLYPVTLCVQNADSCINCYTQAINIQPGPVADFSADTACKGSATHFRNLAFCLGDVITSWIWNFGDGSPTSNLQWPVHTYTTAGTFQVSLVVTTLNGCIADTVKPVVVHDPPVANFSWSQPGGQNCFDPAIPLQFTDLSTITGGNLLASWSWDFGDGTYSSSQNPGHQYAGSGIYYVTLTVFDTNGCRNSVIKQVILGDKPMASFSYTLTNCDLACFNDASVGSGTAIQSWFWDFGDVASGVQNFSTEQNPCHTFFTQLTQTYTVRLIVTNVNGCSDTLDLPVTVSKPVPDFTTLNPACQGFATEFQDMSVSAGNFISAWNWNFGDPASLSNTSTVQNPIHIYNGVGTYYVTLSVTNGNGCTSMIGKPVEVFYTPQANWDFDRPNCFPDSTQFRDVSLPQGSIPISSRDWDFGDGTTPHPVTANPMHKYTSAGTYAVTLTVTNEKGCQNYITKPFYFYPGPMAAFTTDPVSKCKNEIVTFHDISTPAFGNIVTWDWNFGDLTAHATVQNPGHVYTSAGTFVVTLVVTDERGCSDTVVESVIINDVPLTWFKADTACLGNPTHFINQTPGSNLSWLWDFGEPSSGVFNTSNIENPVHQYSSAGEFYVQLTVTDFNSCRKDTVEKIRVVPLPVVNFSHTSPCSGEMVQFTDESVIYQGSITQWSWDFGDGSASDLQNPGHAFASPGPYNVTLTITSTGNCPPAAITKQIMIQAAPIVNFTAATVCVGPVQFVDMTNQNGGTTLISWDWNFGDPASGLNNTSHLQSPIHVFNAAGPYEITLVVANTNGCRDTLKSTVVIQPLPGVDFTAGTSCASDTTCFLVNTTTTHVGAITTFEWDLDGDGSIDSYEQNPCHIYPVPGAVNVTLTVTDTIGCKNSMTHTVSVKAAPVADFNTAGTNCSNDSTRFVNYSTCSAGYIIKWTWHFGDGSPDQVIDFPANPNVAHRYSGTGPYTVKLTVVSSLGCEDVKSEILNLVPSPLAVFTFSEPCLSADVQFSDLSAPNGGGTITSREWNFGDPASLSNNTSVLENPTHAFAAMGTYQVNLKVTSSNGCKKDTTIAVTIKPLPGVEFSWLGSCTNQLTQFTVDPVMTNIPTITTYFWTFGDGGLSFEQNPVHNYLVTGVFPVTLHITDTSGCSNHVTHNITIVPSPQALFSNPGTTCSSDSVAFTNLSTTTYGYIQKWEWDFGDASPHQVIYFPNNPDVKKKYALPGTYSVSLTVTNSGGCIHAYSHDVTVIPTPIANFQYTDTCERTLVHFSDASFPNGVGNIVSWRWNFDDPGSGIDNTSTLQNPTHIFTSGNTTYHVTLIITSFNNCIDTIVKPVFIRSAPPVDFTYDSNCLNKLVNFTSDPVVMPPVGIASWDWDFGDNSAHSTNPENATHLYLAAGTYHVVLTVVDVNGCGNSLSRTLNIVPPPSPGFTFTSATCDSLPVHFTDQSVIPAGFAGYINEWIWNWGDGSVPEQILRPASPNVSHVFPGGVFDFNVQLTVISGAGCRDSITHPVHLIPNPTAAFEVVPGTPACASQPVQFNDLSQANDGGIIIAWLWNFDDQGSGANNTSTSPHPVHLFSNPDTYHVKLIVTNGNGCTDTIMQPVIIGNRPVALFTTSTTHCQDYPVTFFSNSTTPAGTTIDSYHWNFGDNGTSADPSPQHTYLTYGTFPVKLTIVNSNGCADSVIQQVLVNPKPVADFSVSAVSCTGSPVTFTDHSFIPAGFTGSVTSWLWDFGDATTSALQNPTHVFAGTSNSFLVKLTVTTTTGCTGFVEKPVTLVSSPIAGFSHSTVLCDHQPVHFTDLSSANNGGNIQTWLWNFGDPLSGINNTSTLQNPTHLFSGLGPYFVTLIVINSNGCRDTLVSLPPLALSTRPVALFTTSTTHCQDYPVTFFSNSTTPAGTTIDSYHWNFGDNGTSADPSPQHTYLTYGTFPVKLTIVNSNGCVDSVLQQVLVNPKPVVDFSVSAVSCTGSPVSFSDHSFIPVGFTGYITTWLWDFGDATTSGSQNPTHVFTGPATSYLVRLTVTTSTGCIGFVEKPVSLMSNPIANFSHSTSLCDHQPVQFTDISAINGGGAIQTWLWNFGDPLSGNNNNSTLQNPIHLFSGLGPYAITLVVINANGCRDTLLPRPSLQLNEKPTSDFDADTVCQGSPTAFTNQSATPLPGIIVSYLWNFGDTQTSTAENPTHTYATSGPWNVKLTVTNSSGCVKDTTKQVEVLGKPVSLFSYSTPTCSHDSVQFNDLSSTPHGTIVRWEWDFNDGTASMVIHYPDNQNIKHKFPNGGTFNVKLTIITSDSCHSFRITPVQIGYSPVANFAFGTAGCALTPLQFTDQSQLNGGPPITAWHWNFGDPPSGANNISTAQNPAHAYTTGGIDTVRLIITNANGCVDSIKKVVTIHDPPQATFTADTSCMGSPTQFNDASSTPAGTTIINWNWDFGDPAGGPNNTSTLQNPVHTYNQLGTFTVTLQVKNSHQCVHDTSLQITVSPAPTAMFQNTTSCVKDGTQFTDLSIAPGSSIKSWKWDFGDGTPVVTIQNPIHVFTTPGNHMVKLTVANWAGCTDSVILAVLSRPIPDAAFSYISKFCPEGDVFFNDESQGVGGASIDIRQWIFEPGIYAGGQNPVHHFNITNMSYPVTLIVQDTYGCRDTIPDSLVFVKPGWGFTFTNNDTCQGYATRFNPVNLAPGDTLHPVSWNFGDPNSPLNTSTLYRPAHVFSRPGNFTVKMKAQNSDGCIDSIYRDIHVDAAPDPFFSFTSPPCDSTVYFHDSTLNPGTATIVSWKWRWGDGTSTLITPPLNGDTSHLYVNAGIYQVTLVITNIHGCADSVTRTVQRYPCIKAGFTYQDTLRCARYKIAFSDTSLPVTRINRWQWTWGDGSDTTYYTHSPSVTHIYANGGTYPVNLEVQALVNGTTITDNLAGSVVVHATPVTYFSNAPVCLNQVTLFRDTSKTFGLGVTKWDWTFGVKPTDTSSAKNPAHTFDTAGVYNVELVVNNSYGCKDSLTKPTRVFNLPVARFESETACSDEVTSFADKSIKADTAIGFWRWSFGNPASLKDTSNLRNPGYRYPDTGYYSVGLIVKDLNQCVDTVTDSVLVHQSPVAAFTITELVNETPGKIRLNNESSNKTSYIWNFGNGHGTELEVNPVVQYANDTIYTISLVVNDTNGCSDMISMTYEFMFDNLYVPNAFSPTSMVTTVKGMEIRKFIPKGLNLSEYHAMVFDKWGHLLWESSKLDCSTLPSSECKGSPAEGWDGTFNGEPMPQDVYMWKINATFRNGRVWEGSDNGKGSTTTMGTVTLIR